jgi:epoxyqueuosine reductase
MEKQKQPYSHNTSDYSKIIDFIYNKSKEIGIDEISIGSIEKYEELHSKLYKNSKCFALKEFFPECQTIISAGFSYNYDWNNISRESIGYIARYTSANFYKILSKKLNELGKAIKEDLNFDIPDKNFYRVFVNSKINDKLSAYVSGLGYYSKNSLIFIKEKGCRYVLGELLLSVKIPSNEILTSNCGKCDFCVKACPTGALKENGILKKDLCIQHLSGKLDWPDVVNGKSFIKLFGARFFGCTNCIDVCPYNKDSFKIFNKDQELIGFIGTSFDVMNVLKFSKEDYKSFFKNNQLSANWIPEAALARNCLASLYNLGRFDIIEQYLNKIDNYNWEIFEKDFLKNFCFFLLKSKAN